MDIRAEDRCELCGRFPLATTVHHLTPKEEGGSLLPTARLCRTCHRQLHALYTNRDLVTAGLTTIEALQQDPQIAAFLKWVRKQAPGAEPKIRKSRHVRGNR
ncbi:HNH endonuclease [Paenibacillus tepidiphilus]|uniref:HNH endonuclease n=1 Tax=Paenibacillus tepidiphilus TaxID=2608683 RepID=UPI00123B65FD|nr:HNH endonuclease [Paenibacillus tepidiphilus]